MAALKVLSLAAATGRVAYVYLIGDRLVDWRISDKASVSAVEAANAARRWIDVLRPDVIVTEQTDKAAKKSLHTKDLIDAIAKVAEEVPLLAVRVEREHPYPNKYAEAAALAVLYPDLQPWVPKPRRFFDNEHRNTVLFEALALAQSVLRNPTPALVRAMG